MNREDKLIQETKNYYLNEEMIKMGEWGGIYPLDLDTWMTEDTSYYFLKEFGIGRSIINICTLNGNYIEQNYIPISYFKKLFLAIGRITKSNFLALEKKLKKFYPLKLKNKKIIKKNSQINFKKVSNSALIKRYQLNRNLIHYTSIYDQFAWTGDKYWEPLMDKVLTKKLHLLKDSTEYSEALFILTKPREISTTLEEKRAVLKMALAVKNKKKNIALAAQELAQEFGWMPVFVTCGKPWDKKYYLKELKDVIKKDLIFLQKEYLALKNYSKLRDLAIKKLVTKYKINKKDLQIFIDYGLALDTRNEAEYLVSYAGFHLLPFYKEMARRLKLTINELRILFEDEIAACLKGQTKAKEIIKQRGSIVAHGYDKSLKKRVKFNEKDSRELYNVIEKKLRNIDFNLSGDKKQEIVKKGVS
ncbi:MAG: hypothetical protein MUF50_00720, partial [Planctomycetes bacterium]|nr:hypothetical protein [Planctomycetota bacterium]